MCDGATCGGNKWGVDEKWKRNGDFSSTFVLKKANRLRADAACRAIVVFDGCSGPFCYAISGRNAIEQVLIRISHGN